MATTTSNPNDLTIAGTNQSVNQAQGNAAGTTGTNTAVSSTPNTPNTNPPVNTSQPNPATVNATPATGASPTAPNPTEQQVKDALNNPNQATLQSALDTAKASGPPPQTAGEAAPKVQAAMAPVQAAQNAQAKTASINTQLEADPGYQQLVADQKEFNSTENQSASLLDFYNKAVKDAGIPAINSQLLSMKNIIDGTEQDIRNEVQAVSGFATDSQVIALANARNKQLIKNYNNLLDAKKLAMDNIDTMAKLAGEDRTFAQQQLMNKLNFDEKIASYADKFKSNASEGYKNVINAVGYSGFVNSLLNTDPTGKSLAQAEQILGFQPGQLQTVANQEKAQTNLKLIQDAGVTSPYVVNAQGEVMNTQTGYTYQSQEDFQQKTGTTLQDAVAKGAITKLGLPVKQQTELAQLSKAQTDAKYAEAQAQADLAAKNASTASSETSAAKNSYELNFEKANGGMTPTEANAQGQKLQDAAGAMVEKLGTGKIDWGTAYNTLHSEYPDASPDTLNALLQFQTYRK